MFTSPPGPVMRIRLAAEASVYHLRIHLFSNHLWCPLKFGPTLGSRWLNVVIPGSQTLIPKDDISTLKIETLPSSSLTLTSCVECVFSVLASLKPVLIIFVCFAFQVYASCVVQYDQHTSSRVGRYLLLN